MDADPELARLARRRNLINERLDVQRRDLDTWFESHDLENVNVRDLALLEGLLQERRDGLAELLALDDELITFVLKRRNERV